MIQNASEESLVQYSILVDQEKMQELMSMSHYNV